MIRTLNKFLFRSFIGPFIFTFFIAIFILLMQFVWKYVDDLVGKGLEWWIILKLLGLVATTLVSLALPLSILLSSLMTFGNLGEHFELTALKAGGISLLRTMRPMMFFCFFLALVAFYFSNNLLPVANLKMRTLLFDISNKRPELNIKPGIFNFDIDGYVIKVDRKSQDGTQLEHVLIYDLTGRRGNERIILADKGVMELSEDKNYLIITLYNGSTLKQIDQNRRSGKRDYQLLREKFEKDKLSLDLSHLKLSRSDESLFKKNFQMLNLTQLKSAADTLRMNLKNTQITSLNTIFSLELLSYLHYGKIQNRMSASPNGIQSNVVASGNISPASHSMLASDSISPMDSAVAQASSIPRRDSLFILRSSDPSNFYRDALPKWDILEKQKIYNQAEQLIRTAINTLEYAQNGYKTEEAIIIRHEIEWQRKFTLSIACIILFFIGAPLGAIVKKGGLGMPVVFSVIFFVAYHMLSITGEKLAREEVLSPFTGMWLSTFVLFPVGLFLTYKASTDSALFDFGTYRNLIKRLQKIARRSKR